MKAVAFLTQCWHKEDGHGCEYGGGRECTLKKYFLREGKWEKTEQKREVKAKAEGRTKGEGEEGGEKCWNKGVFCLFLSVWYFFNLRKV